MKIVVIRISIFFAFWVFFSKIVVASRIPPAQVEVRGLVFGCSWAGVLLGKTFFEEIRGGLGRGQLDTRLSSHWFEIALTVDWTFILFLKGLQNIFSVSIKYWSITIVEGVYSIITSLLICSHYIDLLPWGYGKKTLEQHQLVMDPFEFVNL